MLFLLIIAVVVIMILWSWLKAVEAQLQDAQRLLEGKEPFFDKTLKVNKP